MSADPDFIETSARARGRIVLAFAITLALAVAAIEFGLPRFFARLHQLPMCEQLDWMRGVFAATLGLLALAAVWLVLVGRRALRLGQSPAPGASVWRRTPVRRGAAARRYGWSIVIAAVSLVIAGVGLWEWTDRYYSQHRDRVCAPDVKTVRLDTPSRALHSSSFHSFIFE